MVTQTQALKSQLIQTLDEDMKCVRKTGVDIKAVTAGRMSTTANKHWRAVRWLKDSSDKLKIRIEVVTYMELRGAKRERLVDHNTVLIMDEVHSMYDTSGLATSVRRRVSEMPAWLHRKNPRVIIGLTGSPLGRRWQDFVGLHNLFAVRKEDHITEADFKRQYLSGPTDGAAVHNETLKKCLTKHEQQSGGQIHVWNSSAAVDSLARKVRPYLFFWDATMDGGSFATRRHVDLTIQPHDTFKKVSVHSAGGKAKRKNFLRTRLVAAEKMNASGEKLAADTTLQNLR